MKDCTTCYWFDTFKPRKDEPSFMGCSANGWEGYVMDPGEPPCMGAKGPLRWMKKEESVHKGDEESEP